MPFLASYVFFKVVKECPLVRHQATDDAFSSCILIINDSCQGQVRVSNYSLVEEFDADELVMMDPRVFHEVTTYARKEQRKLVVFTF